MGAAFALPLGAGELATADGRPPEDFWGAAFFAADFIAFTGAGEEEAACRQSKPFKKEIQRSKSRKLNEKKREMQCIMHSKTANTISYKFSQTI